MHTGRRVLVPAVVCILHFAFCIAPASAQLQPGVPSQMGHRTGIVASNVPPQFKTVTFAQRPNQQMPLDTVLEDEAGRAVKFGDYFGKKPVVLAFVYYQCPMLCSLVMNGISSSLRALPSFTAGEDFDVVLVSFDPRDKPPAALENKQKLLDYWKTGSQSGGGHLLTGDEASIVRITQATGFSYQWDKVTGQFAHPSGVLVATPDGTLSRYFYGVEYSPKELRMALVESGQGKIGRLVDELLLFCYHYDPETGRYGATVMNLVRLGGILTVGAMVTFFVLMRRRDTRTPMEAQP